MYLFDASSLAQLFVERGSGAIRILADESTLDLAAYEMGNIFWKECALKHLITSDKAMAMLRDTAKILETMRVEHLNIEDMPDTLDIALKQSVAFYDASYVHASIKDELVLVTEDKKLKMAASKMGVKAISAKDIGQSD